MQVAKETMENFETNNDQLDLCIWLTEPQCDEIIDYLRLIGPEKRRRRQVADFQGKNFRKWTTTPIHWKFDGRHSMLINAIKRLRINKTVIKYREFINT